MSDIKLVQPSAGQQVVIPDTSDGRLILNFSADQVTIERSEGSESLFFKFEDGGSIELKDFYAHYNKENMPEFEVDGQIIAGADFFEAFGPDLAPAAGPAAANAATANSGHYQEYANASLITFLRKY
ncbi:MAG: hypothetical protein IJS50_05170 [Desulfovibrio sp.]|nr:hypothetical protein [Desulfovibrio sp.]